MCDVWNRVCKISFPLKLTEGLISVMTPLLWFVLWLKKALPPHSFSQMGSRFLEQYDFVCVTIEKRFDV